MLPLRGGIDFTLQPRRRKDKKEIKDLNQLYEYERFLGNTKSPVLSMLARRDCNGRSCSSNS